MSIRKPLFVLSLLSITSLILSACNMPTKATPTPGAGNTLLTSVFQTAIAQPTQPTQGIILPTADISTPIATVTLTPPPPSATPYSTSTQAPPPTATTVPDQAMVVSETIADGNDFLPNTNFTKTWRLKNIGVTTWTTAYALVFVTGDIMSAKSVNYLPGTVYPGQSIDLSLNMVAPANPGKYKGYWKLRTASNVIFGLGPSGAPFWVDIDVVLPPTVTKTPAPPTATYTPTATTAPVSVTSVVVAANPATLTTTCSAQVQITFTGTITAAGSGSVIYNWESSAGASGSNEPISFSGGGTKTVTTTWDFNAGAVPTGWMKLHITSPTDLLSGPASFTVNCTP